MLQKLPVQVFVPGSPAVPAIPYEPERTVCGQSPAPGEWRQVCSTIRVYPNAPNNGFVLPPGTESLEYGPVMQSFVDDQTGMTTVYYQYVDAYVCRSEWVVNGPVPPPVCTTYPEVPAVAGVPAVPSRTEVHIDYAWNAGANSIDEIEGDAVLTFDIGRVTGAVLGLTTSAEAVPARERISHGIYFYQSAGGAMRWAIMEGGRQRTAGEAYTETDVWQIRRAGGMVTYLRNDIEVYRSLEQSIGPVRAASTLYASGDRAP